MATSIGYGPSSLLAKYCFDGDEKNFELWETRIMGYMRIKKLHDVFADLDTERNIAADKNALAFAELIQFLDERSLALIIRDAKDNGRKAFKILKEHYQSSGKPRMISLYTQLGTLKMSHDEDVTDYILRGETAAHMLKQCGHDVPDPLLVAMVLKGLPDEYQAFTVIVTQSETEFTFQKFKTALRNFEETEKHRHMKNGGKNNSNSVMGMKNENKFNKNKSNSNPRQQQQQQQQQQQKTPVCFSCGDDGHQV